MGAAKKTERRHWKSDDERREDVVRVRVTEDEHRVLGEAAETAGAKSLSDWIRQIAMEKARALGVK